LNTAKFDPPQKIFYADEEDLFFLHDSVIIENGKLKHARFGDLNKKEIWQVVNQPDENKRVEIINAQTKIYI
jgi:hypothetical protein